MTTPAIRLRQIRSFDEILSATFRFVRLHFWSLGKILVVVTCFPVALLLLSIAVTFYANMAETVILLIKLQILPYLLSLALVHVVTVCYMKLYAEEPDGYVSTAEIWRVFRRFLMRIIPATLLCFVLIFLGLVFFLIPGIYLAIGSSLTIIIIVHEGATVSAALDRSFRLVRGYWWQTFGILIILLLIQLILPVFLRLPEYIFSLLSSLFTAHIPFSFIITLLSLLLISVGALVSFGIPSVALSFQYYSLVERKEAPELIKRIQEMAQPADIFPRLADAPSRAAAPE